MTPLSEHQLLVFWVQLALLVGTARLLGGAMRRIGQPPVVGELAAGLILGPSILGRLAPDVFTWLFPEGDPVQSGLLLAVAWVGIALLLVTTGFETDLTLLRQLGRPAGSVAIGSLVVPLTGSFVLGLVLPQAFFGETATRTTFALFLSLAMSISALAIVGRILTDMRLMRRNIGQIMIGAVVANDLVGWLLLGLVAGIVAGGAVELMGLVITTLSIAAFLVFALTVGQRLVDSALRYARQGAHGLVRPFTVVVVAALTAGAVTQAIGVEAVFGAFVAGIVIGRSRYQRPEVAHTLETVTRSFFAPVFFATAGLFVDLGLLVEPEMLLWALVVVAVASLTKLAGTFVGGRLGRLSNLEAVAAGVGLNARGTLEIVVATVGLGLGVFNAASYSVVVLLAMVTAMMVPPLLRPVLTRLRPPPDEAARLAREEMMARSIVAKAKQALLPTRGGENSLLAGRILELALQRDTSVTIYTGHGTDEAGGRARAEATADELTTCFDRQRQVSRLTRNADDIATALCTEASLGYGLVALGMTERGIGPRGRSSTLEALIGCCPVPMLLVRHGPDVDPHVELAFRRILVPATGTRTGQAAQEIAFTLGARVGAELEVVHVVDRPDHQPATVWVDGRPQEVGPAASILAQAEMLAQQFGCRVRTSSRPGSTAGRELIEAADELAADVIVLGASVRSYDGEAFLGHGVEYVLEHARQTVLVVLFPTQQQSE